MAIGTIAEMRTYLGIPQADTSEDALLTMFMGQVQVLIENWCDRKFGLDTYTEYYCGNGTQWLAVDQRPIVSIASIYTQDNAYWGEADDSFPVATLLEQGVDYAFKVDGPNGTGASGLVYAINGIWDAISERAWGLISPMLVSGTGNIKITYTAGFADIPLDVNLALYMQVAAIRKSMNYGQLLASENYSDSTGSYSASVANKAKVGLLTPEVCGVLARYRNLAIG